MIPPGFIQELLSRVDIVDVVGRHVSLRKSGANLSGLCPFHAEKSPSFTVSPSKQFYHCFGCGAHGDAIRFLVEHSGLGFIDAVEELAQQTGLPVPRERLDPEARERQAQQRHRESSLSDVLERAEQHFRRELRGSPRAIDYLKRRGLTGEIAARFGLGYAPDRWRGLASVFPEYDDPLLEESGLVVVRNEEGDAAGKRYDRFRDRIMFPIRAVGGRVIGFGGRVIDQGEPKYLNSPETPVFVKGRELYGLHEARQDIRRLGQAIVVEGYLDVVALAQHGLGNAVATLGTACTGDHVAKLLRVTDSVVFSFDGDAAGRRAAQRALEAALPHATDARRLRFLFLPPEHDPDSFIRELGHEAFGAALQAAVPLSAQLIAVARDDSPLEAAEDRAQMLARAEPLVRALPAGLLQRQIVDELAVLARLPAAELMARWRLGATAASATASGGAASAGGGARAEPRRGVMAGRRPAVAPASPADRAASLLLRRCELWSALSHDQQDLLARQPFPHGPFFTWLDRHLHDHGPTPFEPLALAVAASDEAQAFLPLVERLQAALDWSDPEVDAQALEPALRQLRLRAIDEEAELLSAAGSLEPQDLARLRELHALRASLKAAG